jgi:drug/metabolite transporter (DMT)-like permease
MKGSDQSLTRGGGAQAGGLAGGPDSQGVAGSSHEPGRRTTRTARADAFLLVAAVIWGFAFVAQRAGMAYVGPFVFNAIRFALGAAILTPFIHRLGVRDAAGGAARGARGARDVAVPAGGAIRDAAPADRAPGPMLLRSHLLGGLLAGVALFGGISLQQMGIVHTAAGKAGFITGLYVVIVPLMALFWGQRASAWQWLGAVLAVAGLYFLSVTERMAIARGDLLVLGGAVFWAVHVHLIGWLTRSLEPVRLAGIQFWVCAGLSLLVALLVEPIRPAGIVSAAVPILYAGLLSVGVAYTFQVIGQRDAHPAHAAILLSLEAVFAVVGGCTLLGESLTARAMLGCVLMLGAMLVAQLGAGRQDRNRHVPSVQ